MTKQQGFTVLMAAIVSFLASCGESAQPVGTDTLPADQTSAKAGTVSTAAEEIPSLLPPDLDFGGKEIRIVNNYYFESDSFMLGVQEETGDVVQDAVYQQQKNAEAQLNVRFSYQNFCTDLGNSAAAVVNTSVTAGDDEFDLVAGVQFQMVPEVLNHLFVNLDGAEYLHPDQPWWYSDYIRELSVGEDRTYFMTGDLTLGVLRNMSCMYVCKPLYQQHFGNPEEIFREVLDGKWTMDRLAERCTEMYRDINGNGKPDQEDGYGISMVAAATADHFTYNAGVRATKRDENNIPYLMMNNEHTVNFTQKLYRLYYENPGSYLLPIETKSLLVDMPTMFSEGRMLYLPAWFYTSELLRNMDADYAIIPFPKYDENQETYLSLAHDTATVFCIPHTCKCVDAVTAVMEAMALEGYKTVLPAYYELALKVKYNRDSTDEAIRVIDLIHDHATTDFAYIYNYALGGVGIIERDLLAGKKSDFASFYTRREKGYKKRLQALTEIFTELE